MAQKIQAISAYRPRIVLQKRAELQDLVDFIARSTGLSQGTIQMVLTELRDAVLFFNRRGQPVYLNGLGTYTPTIDLNGRLGVGHRADAYLKNQLNVPKTYRGEFHNTDFIGKTTSDLVNKWNAEHPEDLIP